MIEGRATLTVSVHVLFFSASVQLSVERSFSAGGGDPDVGQLMTASHGPSTPGRSRERGPMLMAIRPCAVSRGAARRGRADGAAARQHLPVAAAVGRGDAGRVPRLAGLARPHQGPRPVGQPAVRRRARRPCRPTPAPLRPDIWQAIFTPETIVSPYPRPEYSQRLLVSYPAQDALTFLTSTYQRAATDRADRRRRRAAVPAARAS